MDLDCMVEFRIADELDIPKIQRLAYQTWWPVYSSILSQEQIQYMLDTLYSKAALQKVIREKQQIFFVLYENRTEQAFAAYGPKLEVKGVYKLHKLYVLQSQQKKGFGRMLIERIKTELLSIHIHVLELNVNRQNPARFFYEKLGFKIIQEEDLPIGTYWMNDYVMRLDF